MAAMSFSSSSKATVAYNQEKARNNQLIKLYCCLYCMHVIYYILIIAIKFNKLCIATPRIIWFSVDFLKFDLRENSNFRHFF